MYVCIACRRTHRSQRKRFQKNRLSGGVSAAAAPPAHAVGDADGDGHSRAAAAARRACAAAWNERVRSPLYLRARRSPGKAVATTRRRRKRDAAGVALSVVRSSAT